MSRIRWASIAVLALVTAFGPGRADQPKGIQRRSQVASGAARPAIGLRALLLAVRDFQHLPSERDLLHGEDDARRFAETLQQSTSPLEVRTLTGAEASYQRARQEVQALLGRTTDQEIALIYLSTRAALVGDRAFLYAADTTPGSAFPLTAIPVAELQAAVRRSKAAQVFILADLVVGEAVDAGQGAPAQGGSVSSYLGAVASARPGVFVLSSETSGPLEGPCPGQGPYTCGLIRALHGEADVDRDRFVTLGEISRMLPSFLEAELGAGGQAYSYGQFDSDLGLAVDVEPHTRWSPPPDRVEVCFTADGAPVAADHVFHTGDVVTFAVTVSEEGYLYVVNVGPDGSVNLLFPWDSRSGRLAEASRVPSGTTIPIMPAGDPDPIVFTEPAGPERVYLVWSADRLAGPDELLALARARAAGKAEFSAWKGLDGVKGLGHLSQVDDLGGGHCTQLTPAGDAEAWVAEFTLRHE